MQMYDCPKFEFCSAPICPLLASVSSQSMGNGERVCYYLTEYQKVNSETSFRVLGLDELYGDMQRAMKEIDSSPNTDLYLLRALRLASKTSSRMGKGIALKGMVVLR